MGAGTTFPFSPHLSSSNNPQILQIGEDALEFLILLPPASEFPPRGLQEGFQAEGLQACVIMTQVYVVLGMESRCWASTPSDELNGHL